jgi:hypothetical protein
MRRLRIIRSLLVVACLSYVLMLPCGLEAQSSSGPAPQTHFGRSTTGIWICRNFGRKRKKKLKESGDEQTAGRALEQFLNAFGDGHLSIEWPRSDPSPPHAKSGTVEPLCNRLGYKSSTNAGIDFSLLPGFTAVQSTGSELFSGGLLTDRAPQVQTQHGGIGSEQRGSAEERA